MVEVCKKMQKLLDDDNNHPHQYTKEFHDEFGNREVVSWNDGIRGLTEKSVKESIKYHNRIIDHFQKCKDRGCQELEKRWRPYKRYTDRESMLQ